jgi:hypothetical protein
MLYFANKPDPVFTAILHAALEDMHGMLVDPEADPADAERYWQAQCPLASRCFPLALAVYTMDRLLAASKDPITVYRITDYHWLLLYDCLDAYCEVHSDYAKENPEKLFPVGQYEIGEIAFGDIVDQYFWDTDFLAEASTVEGLGPEGRQVLGLSHEAFGIAQKLVPHYDELKFEALAESEGGGELLSEGWEGHRIPKYPPADDIEEE